MRKLLGFLLLLAGAVTAAEGQTLRPKVCGLYAQWGYNRDVFSRSNLHFRREGVYDFTLHNVIADDKPDFEEFYLHPIDITIPQNSVRIGLYLNPEHTWAIEVNFDHAKYVMRANQRVKITGSFGSESVNHDTTLSPRFIEFEHTDGLNFLQLNFVQQRPVWQHGGRVIATVLGKMGAGVGIPRSEVSLFGRKLNNCYHVAGYIASAEMGTRIYPFRHFFLEASVKAGYANYLNVLTIEGGHANHQFFYGEVIGLLGLELDFGKKKSHDAWREGQSQQEQ